MSTNRVNIIFSGQTDWDFNLTRGDKVPAGVPTSQGGSVSCVSCARSYCRHTFAAVECLKNIFQGENSTLDILLADDTRTLMDLTHLNSAEVYLYDDRNVVTETFIYPYPIVTGVTDIGQHELQIIQQNFGEIIVNRGRIAIDLTEDMTSNMIGGNIYSEIKFAIMDTTYVIGCLLLGKIMPSRINQYSLEI